jgi:hypothetical protein
VLGSARQLSRSPGVIEFALTESKARPRGDESGSARPPNLID